ncbi:MAG: hypothetical protein OEM28_09470 [Nitrosopumilus sp.]|nr:hypothetical protein [Nitrosopumilus sp.]
MTAVPLHKRPWRKLSPRQKMLREKSLAVIGELRNTKSKTLPQAASDNGITAKNVIKHTNGFKKVNGKPVVKKWDRIKRIMRINTNKKEKSVEIKDSRTASVVGRYHNAVKQFLNTGDKSKLSKFRNKKIKDSKGKLHKLETNPDEIIRINQRIEEPEYYEVYNTK